MLTKEEMISVVGGNINWSMWSFVGAGIALFAGIVDGFLRPIRCN